MRNSLRWGLVLALLSGPACARVALADDAPPRPNVLFLAIDDLNDWVGCLAGHPQVRTPNIDRLARRGTLFGNAHCQAPLCNPSRTSLLVGLRPSTTGIYGLAPWFRNVPELRERVSLPQALAAAGYRTLAGGKVYHGGFPPAADRAKEFHHIGQIERGARPENPFVQTPARLAAMDWGVFPPADEQHGDWKIADWAVAELAQKRRQPFFLAVGFHLPHVPCYAPQRWFDLYPEDRLVLPPLQADDRADTPEFSWYLHWKLPEPRLSWLEQVGQHKPLVRAYLASISFIDSQIGRVLDALDRSGQADRTTVVLWSDHGWHLGEKGITGKNSLWERSTRVPLILAGPGVTAGARCTRPVELLDLYPTVLELCGLPPRTDLEGHSLVPLLKQADAPRPWPAITTHNQGNHAVRSQRWRYIRYADGSEELYDLENDPHEWTNVVDDPRHAAVVQQHRAWLPKVDRPPVGGSAGRVLTYDPRTRKAVWEGKGNRPGPEGAVAGRVRHPAGRTIPSAAPRVRPPIGIWQLVAGNSNDKMEGQGCRSIVSVPAGHGASRGGV
jgi:arylsulfatase A-like enzyme